MSRSLILLSLLAATACGPRAGGSKSGVAGVAGAGGDAGQVATAGASGGAGGDAGLAAAAGDAGEVDGAAGAGGADIARPDGSSDAADADDAADASAVPAAPDIVICGGNPAIAYCDFIVAGEGLDELEGKLVFLQVGAPSYQRAGQARTRVVNGKFSVTFPKILSGLYTGWFAVFDADGDGRCGPLDRSVNSAGALSPCASNGSVVIQPTPSAFAAPKVGLCQSLTACRPWL
jgi:hypothetical protein